MTQLSRVFSPLRRLRTNNRGVAALEFALILPGMLFLYLGAAYMTTAATLNNKMQTASYNMMDMVPYPRNMCTYRTFAAQAFSSGFQKAVVGEMISPFPVTDTNPTVTYIEGAPDAQKLVPIHVEMRYSPKPGPFALYNSLTGAFSAVANMQGKVIAANSPMVTVSTLTACPPTNFDALVITYQGVNVVGKLQTLESMAGGTFSVPYAVSGGVPLDDPTAPYKISSAGSPPVGVTFAANKASPYYQGTTVETAPGTDPSVYTATLTATDYTSYLWQQPDKTANTSTKFIVYHKLVMQPLPVEVDINMADATTSSTGQYSGPPPTVGGGKKFDDGYYRFTVTNLPPGLDYNRQTGAISGKVTTPGTWYVTTSVQDNFNNVVTNAAVKYVVIPPKLIIEGPSSYSVIGRQYFSYAWDGRGGYGNISVVSCIDNGLGRMPYNIDCSRPYGPTRIDGVAAGVANELRANPAGVISITIKDDANQYQTLNTTYTVTPPKLNAYTDAPGTINAVYGQYVALNLHTYGGWGNSRVNRIFVNGAQAGGLCCGLQIADLGPAGSEANHTFQVQGTLNWYTDAPQSVQIEFVDSAGSLATTNFTINVPNQPIQAWSDGNIVTTAGWCGNMPFFHSSGGNGSRYVVSLTGQVPPGFGGNGDANNWWLSGCSQPGSGTMYLTFQDSTGHQATVAQYWQFNAPALNAWNDGSAIGTAGVTYSYPAFHSSGGWGARYAVSITGNPPGPGGYGDANSWWLYGATGPGAGYSTLTFQDSIGQRAASAQYWQMTPAPLGCWNDGSMYGTAGNWYQYPQFHSTGGYGNHYVVGLWGYPSGTGGNGDGWNYYMAGTAPPGAGVTYWTVQDDAGQQCQSAQYWQMATPPLYAWNDGSWVGDAGPYVGSPYFHSSGGYGGRWIAAVYGNPYWAGGAGDANNYTLVGSSMPGSGVTTVVYQDQAGQQAATQQYWSFTMPPIYFGVSGVPNLTYYDGYTGQWVVYFRYWGGYGNVNMVNYSVQLNAWYPIISFGIGQMGPGLGYISYATTPYSATVSTIYVQVCDQLGDCPVFAFQLNCNSHMCAAG